jgi:4-amino-4-deoxy-L-arabinose transferase-like glycosyltransferase
MKHNVERFSAPMHGFDGSLFFYVPWLFGATLPHLAPLVNALRSARLIWADDLQRFCLLWFGFVFVFFSLSGTKLPHYVFYGYSGLFVVMALQVGRLRSHAIALAPAAVIFAAIFPTAIFFFHFFTLIFRFYAYETDRNPNPRPAAARGHHSRVRN